MARSAELETALSQIEAAWPDETTKLQDVVANFPLGPRMLCKLLAHSPVSVEKIIRSPQALLWLADPAVCASSRSRRKMEVDWDAIRTNAPDVYASLRKFKAWELLRIALREVAGVSDILETGAELSSIAEICVEEIYARVFQECITRWGDPGEKLNVLAMGKLGGEELNYSSDIDLILFYGEEGEVKPGFSRHEFFNRMTERMLACFSVRDSEGSLFKVDLRLRPEGGSGPLTRSIASMENYYFGFGETWERMALIKARCIEGDNEVAYDFDRVMQAFIYPKSISLDFVDEVASIKSRIERDILEPDELHRNVKLGRGGIREIEFSVQTLQLLHGARHVFLQERSTLRALTGLVQLDFLPGRDAEALRNAYIFLRKVEHRLQIAREEQTHTIPRDPQQLHDLALNLDFSDADAFLGTLERTMDTVRSIFEGVVTPDKGSSRKESAGSQMDFFDDIASAQRMLDKLGTPDASKHVSPRTRQIYKRLRPMLLSQLRNAAEPNSALAGFSDYVEAYGIRGMLFETLVSNPRLLELFVKLFDSSYFLTRAVVRRPQWIEEIARGGELGLSFGVQDHLEAMAVFQTQRVHEPLDRIRVYRQYQVLRIGLRDILEFCDLMELQQEYTALAEACVIEVLRTLQLENKLTVIAMGKFGGRELCYGSDLDVVLIGDDQNAAATFIKEMKSRSAEGLIFPVDARLRPEGDSGPLATPFETYRKYHEGRAQFWEVQALTKARVISGPLADAVTETLNQSLDKAKNHPNLLSEIAVMHDKIVRNRSGVQDELFFKTGKGGVMAVEFLVQAMEILHGLREPNTALALGLLKNSEALPGADADRLRAGYLFLRRLETALRRIEDASVSQLPADAKKQREIARHLGFEDKASFFERYDQSRAQIREIFEKIFPPVTS